MKAMGWDADVLGVRADGWGGGCYCWVLCGKSIG